MKYEDAPDPDDMFSDTRMTFGEHIEDLRTHLIRAVKGFVLGMLLSLLVAKPLLGFITKPVDDQLRVYYKKFNATKSFELQNKIAKNQMEAPLVIWQVWLERKNDPKEKPVADPDAVMPELVPALHRFLKEFVLDDMPTFTLGDMVDPRTYKSRDWEQVTMMLPDPIQVSKDLQDLQQLTLPPSLTSLSIQEPFVVFFKVALMAGFVLASPWVFYQIWSFVAAGLYPHEKRLVNVYLPISIVLFLVGVFVCEFLVLPKAVEALLWFNEWLGIQPELRLNEWLGFAIFMPLIFGVSFQTPLVMLFTYMIGLFDIEVFKAKRRISFFLMAIFAAVITPSTDAFSMLFLWVPMCLLYELGIFLCWYKGRGIEEEPFDEPGELVEV